jgi:hypothetical protein
MTYFLTSRQIADVDIMKVRGSEYQADTKGNIVNLYELKVFNRTFNTLDCGLILLDQKGDISITGGKSIDVKGNDYKECMMTIQLPKSQLKNVNTKVKVGLTHEGKVIQTIVLNFMGPF